MFLHLGEVETVFSWIKAKCDESGMRRDLNHAVHGSASASLKNAMSRAMRGLEHYSN